MNLLRPHLFERRPSCILLDLDNTLYPYDVCHRAGMTAARQLALDLLGIDTPDFDRCFDDARAEVKARLGETAAAHNRLLYFQRMLERAGIATRPLEALQLEQAYWLAYLDAMTLFPDVVHFLDDVRMAGIPSVIVTDLTVAIQLRKMIALRLDAYIDWLVSSEESGHDKPHRASFELALAKLGGVEGPVWMIGDNPPRDLTGAKQSIGAVTLHFSYDGTVAQEPDRDAIDGTIRTFADLRKLFARALVS